MRRWAQREFPIVVFLNALRVFCENQDNSMRQARAGSGETDTESLVMFDISALPDVVKAKTVQ